jgi:hypothetical protein
MNQNKKIIDDEAVWWQILLYLTVPFYPEFHHLLSLAKLI